ncbi:MAG TPA: HAMP domain-containing sensor histidine kinase [Candidatus Nitrosocosmicus sp.]|nr:HAMP domain-containing sensor histidine kinase [Candidatus Nitrosocosmicus sp.]
MASGKYDEKSLPHHGLHLHKNTQILYGAENAVGKGVEFMKNVKQKMDITFDHKAPSIVIEIPQYYDGYQDILKRGGKIRCITEITKENLQYCEELVKTVTELRHMDGLKGGIAINETEYMATTVLQESQPLTEVIYSNVDEVVAQGQFIFDTLWKNAITAQRKIKELKEGIISYETRLITESNDSLIETEFGRVVRNSSEINVCTSIDGLRINKNIPIESITNALINDRINTHKGIRILVEITRDNLEIIKELLDLGIQIRHIKNISSIDYTVTNSDLIIAVKRTEKNDPSDSILYSNDPSYLDHFTNVFEEMWKSSKDPERVIKSLEEETELSFIETIDDPEESVKLVRTLISSAKYEILGILPNFNSFLRQVDSGMMEFMKDISGSKKNVNIRILLVEETNNEIQHKILTIFDKFNGKITGSSNSDEIPLEFQFKGIENFKLKILNSRLFTEIGFLIVDKSKSLIIESKNISSIDVVESIGLSSYSNSHRISKSYASIFEALWNQAELYDKLKLQERLQKEFINIAAHELRNPVQSLLGFSDILMNTTGNIENYNNFIVTINQSTKRLARLIDKVLDVTQLENELLILNKENFSLEQLVLEIVKEYNNNIHLLNKNQLEIRYDSRLNDCHNTNSERRRNFGYVFADRTRIIQVIVNILENAVEFTDRGTITLRLDENKTTHEILLTISDSGRGIDPEILPNLFSKFVSKSRKGTGLGLYISKKIIETHGGRIWAENCYDENNKIEGSKFTLTLPSKGN